MRIAKQLLTEAVIGIMIGATVYLTTLMLRLNYSDINFNAAS